MGNPSKLLQWKEGKAGGLPCATLGEHWGETKRTLQFVAVMKRAGGASVLLTAPPNHYQYEQQFRPSEARSPASSCGHHQPSVLAVVCHCSLDIQQMETMLDIQKMETLLDI